MKKQKYLDAQLLKLKKANTPLSNAKVSMQTQSLAQAREHAREQTAALASDDTGANLMEALRVLSNTARVQASMSAGNTSIDPKLIRGLKDLAAAWSQVHAEVRTSLQALTDEDFRNLLLAQNSSKALVADPLVPGDEQRDEIEQLSPNFPLSEVSDAVRLDDTINAPVSAPAMPLIDFDED